MEEKVNELTNVRKLATIARILKIEAIPDADNIETVYVRGWQCVAKKGEFKVDDLCVYAEVDSVFPDGLAPEKALEWKALQKELSKAATEDDKIRIKAAMEQISKLNMIPQFEFLRGSKFRIKTKRIFGEISQGICFPISIILDSLLHRIPEYPSKDIPHDKLFKEDDDITDILSVTQYVPPDPAIMGGDAKGDMQNVGLLISDEERIENLSGKYEILKQFKYYKTEKLDGTSFTAYIKNGVFGVTGRTIEFKVPEDTAPIDTLNVYWKMAKKLDLENKIRTELTWHESEGLKNVAFQGELVGEGIQSNLYKLKGQTVCFYNAWDIDKQEYIDFETFLKMIEDMELKTVPILDVYYELPEKAIDLLIEADKTTSVFGNNPKQLIEGFVYVAHEFPKGTKVTRSSFNRLSFKAKSRTFDMKRE